MSEPERMVGAAVAKWVEKASGDLAAAEYLFASDFSDYWIITFHAQQAVEKFLKAACVRHQLHFPKIHDLQELREILKTVEPELARRLADADRLTPFAVAGRYPRVGPLAPEISRDDASAVLETARRLCEALREHLESLN